MYDDSGSHAGMTAAEIIARKNVKMELVSPERFLSPDMGGMNFVPYMKAMHEHNIKITPATRLHSVSRQGNQLLATLCSDFSPDWRDTRVVDQVVVEHATSPNEDLYFSLQPDAKNAGEINYKNLISDGDILETHHSQGRYFLYRNTPPFMMPCVWACGGSSHMQLLRIILNTPNHGSQSTISVCRVFCVFLSA